MNANVKLQNIRLFISHSSDCKARVREIVDELDKKFKTNSLMDDNDFQFAGGRNLYDTIEEVIGFYHFFLLFIGKNTFKSSWVKKELTIALKKEAGFSQSTFIIPVYLEEDASKDVPEEIQGRIRLSCFSQNKTDIQAFVHKIADTLNSHILIEFHKSQARKQFGLDLNQHQFSKIVLPKKELALPNSKYRYDLVVFDLDGTILNGIKHSWQLVWKHLKIDDKIRKEWLSKYLRNEIDYIEWCRLCCNILKEEGLSRKAFDIISQDVDIIKGFERTIYNIRKAGMKTVLISGGIDTLVEVMLPSFYDYFDSVFLNSFRYDHKGNLSHIVPTLFDFEGKWQAIAYICGQFGIDKRRTVFVGDGYNDLCAMESAGLSIALNPTNETVMERADRVYVDADNLAVIEQAILGDTFHPYAA